MRLQERVYQAGAGSLQPCKLGIDSLALDWPPDSQGVISGLSSQRSHSACWTISEAWRQQQGMRYEIVEQATSAEICCYSLSHDRRLTSFLWASLSAAALRTASRVALVVAAARASGGTKGLVLGCLTSSGECAKKQICAARRM